MTRVHSVTDTPIGELTLVAENGALSAIYFPGHKRLPDTSAFGARTEAGFSEAKRQLAEYFAGERTVFTLPLAPRGDAFQLKVWELLQTIPYGQTRTYGQLARQLGDPHLAQAVGNANGRNPLSIVVPCHRVIGADGSLVGYAGGLERKRFLLELEEPPEARAARLF
ncbi:methylated-DNA--[protein]-cysteine S-methyltransferase [Arthrobacter sp. I2-34]|uniref:Methylated-DNA--protein-cysteine methyltransferase n=1 Tax=Arthrobacter hankyongi TaxID=2904801 RepID=A0ABS9L9C7_9MICC|nr:methylated-DNA--[protein]-cysteine S-methyltransferase [Arthrobacter hankyongi]MCG2623306.1 methylated-DNA--[protein]-cysteine S-methyltransferase [Arthrobacter hankyongi]